MTDEQLLALHANEVTPDEFWIAVWADRHNRADTLTIIKMCLDLGIDPPTDYISVKLIVPLYDRLKAAEARIEALENA